MIIDLNKYQKINPRNGRFLKGITPHNKGKNWSEWMDPNKQERVLKNLHRNGNPNIGGNNAIKIIGIKNGKFCPFESSKDAERKYFLAGKVYLEMFEKFVRGGVKNLRAEIFIMYKFSMGQERRMMEDKNVVDLEKYLIYENIW